MADEKRTLDEYLVTYIDWTRYIQNHSDLVYLSDELKEYIDYAGLSSYSGTIAEDILIFLMHELDLSKVFMNTYDNSVWIHVEDAYRAEGKSLDSSVYKSIAIYQSLEISQIEARFEQFKPYLREIAQYQTIPIAYINSRIDDFIPYMAEILTYQEGLLTNDIESLIVDSTATKTKKLKYNLDWNYIVTNASSKQLNKLDKWVLKEVYTNPDGNYLLSDDEMTIYLYKYPDQYDSLNSPKTCLDKFLPNIKISNPNILTEAGNIFLTKGVLSPEEMTEVKAVYPDLNIYNIFYSTYIISVINVEGWEWLERARLALNIEVLPANIWTHLSRVISIPANKLSDIITKITNQTYLFTLNQYKPDVLDSVWDNITNKELVFKYQTYIDQDFLLAHYKDIPESILSDESISTSTLNNANKTLYEIINKEADV